METERINFSIDDDPSKVLESLCGQVFHVTKLESYHKIIIDEEIRNNKNGEAFGLENTGTSKCSYSVANGCVALFDLRDKHHEHDREWIDEWLLKKYHIFSLSHFRITKTDEIEQFAMSFLVLDPKYYKYIISYEDVKSADPEILSKQHLIPYTECWIEDKVPVEWIQKIYEVHVERKPFATKIYDGKTDEEIQSMNHELSELIKMAQEEDC